MSLEAFVTLGDTLSLPIQTRDITKVPVNATSLPTYRIYGPTGVPMSGGTGTVALCESGSITAASNASPIVITSTAHGLSTGTRVHVANVGGNTAANGDFSITVVNANSFQLDGSTGNGAYTSGGVWNTAGWYLLTHALTIANNYEQDKTYSIVVDATVSAVAQREIYRVIVV